MSLLHKNTTLHQFSLLLCTLTLTATSYAQNHTTQITSLKGERWWGAFVGNAPEEPFISPFKITTGGETSPCVPMLVSSSGRYVWSDSPVTIDFDGNSFTITSIDASVEVQRGGRTLRDAYLVCRHKNFPPISTDASLDLFSLPIFETESEFGWLQTADLITGYAERLHREGITKGIIVLSPGWNSITSVPKFDGRYYADPKGFIDRLHELGFKVMLTVTPYCSASGRDYAANLAAGNIFKSNGTPMFVHTQCGLFAVSNILSDGKTAEIRTALLNLVEQYGVDGFRFDCEDVVKGLGHSPVADRFAAAWQNLGSGFALTEFVNGAPSRSTSSPSRINSKAGGQYSYINDMLTAGLSGYTSAYASPSAVELSTASDMELLRALQQDLIMPSAHIRFAPWRIHDKKLYEAFRRDLLFRCSISEYIAQVASDATKTAEPVARHLEYNFPKNGFADCSSEYMLGEKYLVAPVANDENKRMVRLPRGVWQDLEGNRYRGPVVVNADVSDGKLLCYELL